LSMVVINKMLGGLGPGRVTLQLGRLSQIPVTLGGTAKISWGRLVVGGWLRMWQQEVVQPSTRDMLQCLKHDTLQRMGGGGTTFHQVKVAISQDLRHKGTQFGRKRRKLGRNPQFSPIYSVFKF